LPVGEGIELGSSHLRRETRNFRTEHTRVEIILLHRRNFLPLSLQFLLV
jgi:hypothetical protein